MAIDLVLAGDNAIVVGMAATVPLEQRRKVIFWGIGAAIGVYPGSGMHPMLVGTVQGQRMKPSKS